MFYVLAEQPIIQRDSSHIDNFFNMDKYSPAQPIPTARDISAVCFFYPSLVQGEQYFYTILVSHWVYSRVGHENPHYLINSVTILTESEIRELIATLPPQLHSH